jgi:hypothetical protein
MHLESLSEELLMLDICIFFTFSSLVSGLTVLHDSHHMTALRSIIQVLSMLMLSLTHRVQYYQASPDIPHYPTDPELYFGAGSRDGPLLSMPSLTIIGHHSKIRRAFATGIAVSVSLISISF